jgi:hypothetical protein
MLQELSIEDRLCLLLARARFSPDVSRQAAELLKAGANWNALLKRARVHGLIPLVYRRLQALEPCSMPEKTRRDLAQSFALNAIRNQTLVEELGRVLELFARIEVLAIPLKGVVLAEALYGDTALRICADLDVLIQPKDFESCLQALRSEGYSDRLREPLLARLLANYGKDCLLMRADEKAHYSVQVHCGLIWGGPAERQSLNEVWQDAVPRHFHDAPAYAMDPEWEFLYLALHAARHGMFPFKWLVDLDWIVARGGVDWPKVKNLAARFGWENAVRSSLAASALLLDTPIPEPCALVQRGGTPKIFTSDPGSLQVIRETLFNLRLLPTFSRRLQFLAIRLFIPTPADCEWLRLPSFFFFVYCFLRPWRLMWEVAGWTIQAGIELFRR